DYDIDYHLADGGEPNVTGPDEILPYVAYDPSSGEGVFTVLNLTNGEILSTGYFGTVPDPNSGASYPMSDFYDGDYANYITEQAPRNQGAGDAFPLREPFLGNTQIEAALVSNRQDLWMRNFKPLPPGCRWQWSE
ncbi:MAG: hypothetical protein ACRDQF_17605, partial [Thermocrispum sp.]